MEPVQLQAVYHDFAPLIRGTDVHELPMSIDSHRFLTFEAHETDLRMVALGTMATLRFNWGKLLPLLGSMLDEYLVRRLVVQGLKPLFARRELLTRPTTKLYGDFSIGLAAFPLFGMGLPSGLMIADNLWRHNRKRTAMLGLFAPPVVIFGVW